MERARLGLRRHSSQPARSAFALKVALLILVQLALAGAFAVLAEHAGYAVGSPATVLFFTAAFVVAGALNMRLEFRRHQFTFTFADAVLSASFFALGPLGVGIAAAVGEGVSLGAQRVTPLKVLYNMANRLASATVAAVAFRSLGHTSVDDVVAWGAAIGAALCFSFLDVIFTAAVLAMMERARFHDVFVRSVPTAMLTTLAAAPLGVIALSLADRGAMGPVLLVPIVAAVVLNSRHAAAQRDEHLRFERLYEASSRTAHVIDLDAGLRLLAAEARGLGTGMGAVCCTHDVAGRWIGVLADDDGVRPAPAAVVDEVVGLAAGDARELELGNACPGLAQVVPGAASVVVAGVSSGQAGPVAIAVMREGRPDVGAPARVQTLAAFANNASLTAASARLYAELEAALARQVDLNRQKGDFVAAVSHELRTPLTVMLAATHTLRKLADRIPAEQRLELLDASMEQGARLQRLIDELLLVAAADHDHDAIALRSTDLDALVAELERDSRVTTGGRLLLEVPRTVGRISSDAARLRQILVNLLDNAAKYAPEGPIELHVTKCGSEVTFAVVDHGPGIPEADRERVFEQFVQLDQSSTRRQGGTGLGLYLCRRLTAVLDGTLTLDGVPGGGCRFSLTIPGVPVEDPVAAAPPAEDAPRFAGVRARPAELARAAPAGAS